MPNTDKDIPPEFNNFHKKIEALFNEKFQLLKEDFEQLKSKLSNSEKTIQKLKKNNEELEEKLQKFYNNNKKNSLIIFGLEENNEEDLYQAVLNVFSGILSINTTKEELSAVYRFGKPSKSRPILVKFLSFHKKSEILKNAKLLKGSQIAISLDLTKEERENQKILYRHYREARSQGLDAKIKKNELAVEGETYTIQELLNLEKNQNQVPTTTPNAKSTKNNNKSKTDDKETTETKNNNNSINTQRENRSQQTNSFSKRRSYTGPKTRSAVNKH